MSNRLVILSCRVLVVVLMAWSVIRVSHADESLIITGSDTMGALLTDWAQDFHSRYPGVPVEVQAAGSAAAPTALVEGTANFGAMSRQMSEDELELFISRQGFLPRSISVGRDALAIIVHPDNPLESLTLQQVDQIFSTTLECGGLAPVNHWAALLSPRQKSSFRPRFIERYGRTAISGSYGFFKREALCDGDFEPGVIELPGFSAIVEAVAHTPGGIAYVGAGFTDHRVKVLSLVPDRFVAPLADNPSPAPLLVTDWKYPLSRQLFLYLTVAPGTRATDTECAFIRYTNTPAARDILLKRRFLAPDSDLDPVSGRRDLDVCD